MSAAKPLILYHADCADGFCAAWVAWRVFGENAEYIAVQYGQEPPPHLGGRRVYILDFSYKRPVLEEMSRKAEFILVLDHHKTAQAELQAIGQDPFTGYFVGGRSLVCVFNMDKSGGRLAWEHFFPGKPSPWLVDYTEDRDLWRWKLEESKEVNACLASWPRTFAEWDKLAFDSTAVAHFADQGSAILRYQQQLIDSICKNATEIELDGHKVLSTNATVLISEVGNRLSRDRPFSATFFIRDDGKRVWSLRSQPDGQDVSEIAKRRGGGGHKNAAGFVE